MLYDGNNALLIPLPLYRASLAVGMLMWLPIGQVSRKISLQQYKNVQPLQSCGKRMLVQTWNDLYLKVFGCIELIALVEAEDREMTVARVVCLRWELEFMCKWLSRWKCSERHLRVCPIVPYLIMALSHGELFLLVLCFLLCMCVDFLHFLMSVNLVDSIDPTLNLLCIFNIHLL